MMEGVPASKTSLLGISPCERCLMSQSYGDLLVQALTKMVEGT